MHIVDSTHSIKCSSSQLMPKRVSTMIRNTGQVSPLESRPPPSITCELTLGIKRWKALVVASGTCSNRQEAA